MFSLRQRSAVALRSSAAVTSSSSSASSSLLPLTGKSWSTNTPVRHLNIHEYQAMSLFSKYGIPTVRSGAAATPDEAFDIAASFARAQQQKRGAANISNEPKHADTKQFHRSKEHDVDVDVVVKAQVLTGGRGRGTFDNGFQGGVQITTSASAAKAISSQMLGHRLVTKQSGPEGKLCSKVLITERKFLRREAYFSILYDRKMGGPVMVASSKGGMDIEHVAATHPEAIAKEAVSLNAGPSQQQLFRLADTMGFHGRAAESAAAIIQSLWKIFVEKDATLVEINPLAETIDYDVLCMDAKVNFDENALFRQPDIAALHDVTQVDPREVEAESHGLNYIGLDGNIGCLVNGAGLAMATMDAIGLYGGSPANFLDLGGGASKDQVIAAFKLLNGDKKVKAILVNIFGGIMRCDVIALGLISAANQLGVNKPVVIRLAGTNVDEARKLIDDSGLRMLTAADLGDAAQRVVRIVDILRMAEEAKVTVDFKLPI